MLLSLSVIYIENIREDNKISMDERKIMSNKTNNKKEYEELISIIIPVYNVEKYIEKCIHSVMEQTYKNIEIIMINDGSTDNCGKICDEYAKKDNRIKVIHQKNEGVSSARNKGIRECTGKYIGFVDGDDIIDTDMFEKLYESITKNESDLAICNYYPNKDFCGVDEIIDIETALDLILDKDKYKGFVVNKLYKKSILKDQKFDEKIDICEDLIFNCQYIIKCCKCSIVNEKLYNYISRPR